MAEQEKELVEQVEDYLKKDLKRIDQIKDDEKKRENLEIFERLYKTHLQAQADTIRCNNEIFRREFEEELEKERLEYQKELDKSNSKVKIAEIVAKIACSAGAVIAGVAYGRSHTNRVLKFSETGTLGNIESSLLKDQAPKVPGIQVTHF